MAIKECENFKIDKTNYHSVFIPTTNADDFQKMLKVFFTDFGLVGHPDCFLVNYYDDVKYQIVGTHCEVSTKLFMKKKVENFLKLPTAEQKELEAEYMSNLLKTCQKLANKYHITLYYKACLMFPIKHYGRRTIFVNYEITWS